MYKVVLAVLFSVSLYGVPAYHGEKEFKQSDNSTFIGQLKGDEWFSWVETKDGYMAKYNKSSKDYEYMILDSEGNIVYSNVKVKKSVKVPKKVKKIPYSKISKVWKSAWINKHKR